MLGYGIYQICQWCQLSCEFILCNIVLPAALSPHAGASRTKAMHPKESRATAKAMINLEIIMPHTHGMLLASEALRLPLQGSLN
jgi:hypothetical protein